MTNFYDPKMGTSSEINFWPKTEFLIFDKVG